jgi:hypothetical protein
MKRSAGVTAAAVVLLLGSGYVCFIGVLLLFEALTHFGDGNPANAVSRQTPLPIADPMILGAPFVIGFAAWGLSTAIGLLRLKAWSRISTLIFGGLLAITAAFPALTFTFQPFPATLAAPEHFDLIFRVFMEAYWIVLLFIAAWWLVLFTRKTVVAQFSDPALVPAVPGDTSFRNTLAAPTTVPPRPQRPLSITIIAWLYVVSVPLAAPFLLISQARNAPMPFFWTMLEGPGAWVYIALLYSSSFAAGIALLRNKAWGLWLAIGHEGFGLMKLVMTLLLPGGAQRLGRVEEYFRATFQVDMPAQSAGFLMTHMLRTFAFGALVPLICLWFLWTGRKRFLEFAAHQEHTRSTAS